MNDTYYQSKRRRLARRNSRYGWKVALTVVTMVLLAFIALAIPLILRAN
ncbi:hypothetical protein [Ideonella sp. A 288]|nr:hypothetical protein [Ideonella sp. A 288]